MSCKVCGPSLQFVCVTHFVLLQYNVTKTHAFGTFTVGPQYRFQDLLQIPKSVHAGVHEAESQHSYYISPLYGPPTFSEGL